MAGPEEQEGSPADTGSATTNSGKPAQQQAPTATVAHHQPMATVACSSGGADASKCEVESRANGIASAGADNMATSPHGQGREGTLGSEQAAPTRCAWVSQGCMYSV